MARWVKSSGLGVLALMSLPGAARAWFWDPPPPPPEPPPIHVYDYSRGPVWTPNGWAYVPIEVHFPRTHPTVIVPPQVVDLERPPAKPKRKRAHFDNRPPLPSMKDLAMPPPPAARRKGPFK
ncbi:MAG: hypothetical protein NW223_10820 [Hyphomicrobiaceae bacterium]|nr:hypothetical protein [Hyphomicrobiaceae bacterium]